MRSADKTQFPDVFATAAGVLNIEAALAETGVIADASSPRARHIEELGMIGFEDTASLWGREELALGYPWADSYLWTDGCLRADGYVWADPDPFAEGYLWADESPEADLEMVDD